MPLYEYQCDSCSHRFEVIQKFSDAPPAVCPKCGGTVQKLPSSPAIQFKGSGFYITDYARAGKSDGSTEAPGKTDSGAAPSEGTPAAASSDSAGGSKPDAKAETKPAASSDSKPSASPKSD